MATKFGTFLKNNAAYFYLGGGACAGLAILYPNTFGLENYKNLMAIHTPDGQEEQVDVEFIKLAEEIADNLQWSKEQRERTKLFPCPWVDFVHKGSCNTRWGAAVGVPGHMVPSLRLVDKMISSGKLGNFIINFDLPPGQNLLKSLEMMSNAKKFSLAKQMCEIDSNHEFVMAGITAATLPGAYFITRFLQIVTGFYRVRLLKIASYVLVFPSVFITHIFLKDAYNCRRQEKIDEKLASLGPEMAKSGADYYSALLLRNQAFLALCGKFGAGNITYYGNARSIWRKPEPLLTERRDRMRMFFEN